MSGYGRFAEFYDRLTENVRYDLIAEAAERYTERFGGRKGIVLDLACGTGSLCEQLARRGFDVIGADASDGMLSAALDKKFDSGLPIQYLRQEMTQLDMFGTIDLTVCTLDSINHLASLNDVRKVFENVAFFSELGGLFIFDVNTVYKHRKILADITFTYETDDVYCVWENTLNRETDEVKMNLEFFEREENGLWSRSSYSFSEKAYCENDIEELLSQCGFELLGKYGDDTFDSPAEDCQRIVYTARCIRNGQTV